MEFTRLESMYVEQVARLHIDGISTGFISSLGVGFVTALYEAIAEDDNSFGFVAIEDSKVLGFIAFSANLSKLYKFVVLKKGIHILHFACLQNGLIKSVQESVVQYILSQENEEDGSARCRTFVNCCLARG